MNRPTQTLAFPFARFVQVAKYGYEKVGWKEIAKVKSTNFNLNYSPLE